MLLLLLLLLLWSCATLTFEPLQAFMEWAKRQSIPLPWQCWATRLKVQLKPSPGWARASSTTPEDSASRGRYASPSAQLKHVPVARLQRLSVIPSSWHCRCMYSSLISPDHHAWDEKGLWWSRCHSGSFQSYYQAGGVTFFFLYICTNYPIHILFVLTTKPNCPLFASGFQGQPPRSVLPGRKCSGPHRHTSRWHSHYVLWKVRFRPTTP